MAFRRHTSCNRTSTRRAAHRPENLDLASSKRLTHRMLRTMPHKHLAHEAGLRSARTGSAATALGRLAALDGVVAVARSPAGSSIRAVCARRTRDAVASRVRIAAPVWLVAFSRSRPRRAVRASRRVCRNRWAWNGAPDVAHVSSGLDLHVGAVPEDLRVGII
eukprot:scaffold3635_cov31-Tisochrysis_lutea.AAC.4